ncbi:MAG TPA: hypothetical protein PLW55_11925, partial [Leptospiraceae bacterium]|nr:hypothetical protein [Leptospiraceae bacterium]
MILQHAVHPEKNVERMLLFWDECSPVQSLRPAGVQQKELWKAGLDLFLREKRNRFYRGRFGSWQIN